MATIELYADNSPSVSLHQTLGVADVSALCADTDYQRQRNGFAELLYQIVDESWIAFSALPFAERIAQRFIDSFQALSYQWVGASYAILEQVSDVMVKITDVSQREKNQVAIGLLDQWLADDSGYDECVWPKLKAAIEENRLSSRRRFSD